MKALDYTVENWLVFLRLSDNELLQYCRTDVFKATGKGGQKKNKTSNAIRLTFGHLVVTESLSRSKAENTRKALKKLRFAIATDIKHINFISDSFPPPPAELVPYLNTSEIKINPKNPVFPIFTGYLFNCIIHNKGNWSQIGQDLGFTSSQLRKFVVKHRNLKQLVDNLKTIWSTNPDFV